MTTKQTNEMETEVHQAVKIHKLWMDKLVDPRVSGCVPKMEIESGLFMVFRQFVPDCQ